MKKQHIALVISLLALGSAASAQDKFQGGYFLDNFSYNYRLNPSLMAERSFFGLGMGNIEAGLASDISVSNLLFPNADGTGLVTGLNKNVSADQFLSGLKPDNALGMDAGLNVFSCGRRKENNFFTFELNLRADVGASLPYELFSFLKQGSGTDGSYDLSGFRLGAKSYAEIAVGGAHVFAGGRLTLGARVKGLVGIAAADLTLDQATATINGSEISSELNGGARIACAPLSLTNDKDGKLAMAFDQTALSPSGYGAAIDLGATWRPISGLSLTAGINDLGGIKWNYNALAKTAGSGSFNGFNDVDTDTDFNKELESATDSFKNLINLQAVSGNKSEFEMLAFTANAGARYKLPFLSSISFGAFGIYHFDSISPYWDARLGATATPFNFFSFTANYGFTPQGNVLGLAASVSLFFVNAYFGLDSYVGRMTAYPVEGLNVPVYGGVPVPVDPFRFKFTFGVNIQLGHRFKA